MDRFCSALLAVVAASALACASPSPDAAAEEGRGALPEPMGSATRFELCQVGTGDAVQAFQVLVHAEGEDGQGESGLDERANALALVEAQRLFRASRSPGSPPVRGGIACEEIPSPQGDVDFEIHLAVAAAGISIDSRDRRQDGRVARADSDSTRCQRIDAGELYCAASPEGVAVRSARGPVVCARGGCVADGDDWYCSRRAGGEARMTPAGAQCDYGCYRPTVQQCQRM